MSQRIEGIEGDGNLSPLRSHPVSATHSAESRTSTQSNAGGSTGKIKKSPGVKATEGSKNGGGGPPLAATATPGRPRPPSNATATKVVPERYPGDLASLVPLNPVEASHLIKRGDTIAASSHTKHAAVAGSGGAAHATLGLGLGLGQGQGQGQVPGQRRPPVDPVLEAGSMSMEPLQQQQPISFRSPKSTGGSISVSSSPHLRAQPHSLAHRSPASAKRPTALNLPSIPPFRPRNSPSVTTAGGGGMVPSSSSGIGSSSGGNTHFMSSPKPPQPPAALLGQFPGISRQRSISTAIVKKDKEPALDRDEPKGTNQ
ncbi:hypothetical protein BJ085DRAFT_39099 [Dimargaris cristalligena]|uniref:Uncharacterized protein n=1 Tax=Dimargaris cristalligena TaxID=215637 RepID=A0A4Q0A161_9FUNG|nr:hypothetical protein BJ085DRAFT_39099 [Dimargaris cristalligena]|eukprot:RKP39488.1 hypothetical protein BJ085DRAFT_39099 [Dimargaris cristalligena]